jgi:hypothetical protein
MQTRGPIRDYSRYALSARSRNLRPKSQGEISDAAAYAYRTHFGIIGPLCLVPSLYVSTFILIFFLLVFPRLFETEYANDLSKQVVEFAALLFGGLTIGFAVCNVGLAKIATICHVVVQSTMLDEELSRDEIERRANKLMIPAYQTLLRSVLHVVGILLLSLAPLVIGGLLLPKTSSDNFLPGILAFISIVSIPIGFILMLMRVGVGMGSVCVNIAEGLSPKESLKRAKYLFGTKSKPVIRGNPALSSGFVTFIIYLCLRAGFTALISSLDVDAFLLEHINIPVLKILVNIIINLLPEFIFVWLAIPYIGMVASFFYYERKIAVEGMDIEVLYKNLPAGRR